MSALRKIKRVGKRATKFQFTATYQSVVVECLKEKWVPNAICVAWYRRGRRFITKSRRWQPAPDNKVRGVVVWPEPEVMDITVTLYKGPKDKTFESKEWEFAVIDVDDSGKRKVLATYAVNMVRYASSLPYEHDLHLRLKPVSKKIKKVILELSLSSEFLKEGKATDDDMMSIASSMSISNLSTIGFLEDDEDEDPWSQEPTYPVCPASILSTDELIKWAQEVTDGYHGVKVVNMTTSWRNGMGFLAIMHYYNPDLIDYNQLSPTSIKENNRMAFELARSLGISCPLTANMMLTSTVPDKLAITSFIFQMYNYFTKAMPSAITKDTSNSQKNNAGSPFDLSAFEQFTFDKLPSVSSQSSTSHGLQKYYSKHHQRPSSLDDHETSTKISPVPPPEESPTTIYKEKEKPSMTPSGAGSPTMQQKGSMTPPSGTGSPSLQKAAATTPPSSAGSPTLHSTPIVSSTGRQQTEPLLDASVSDVKLVLDSGSSDALHVAEQQKQQNSSNDDTHLSVDNSGVTSPRRSSAPAFSTPANLQLHVTVKEEIAELVPSSEQDRELECEFPSDSDLESTHSLPQLLNGSVTNVAEPEKPRRKLPALPESSTTSPLDKHEERKKKAKELLGKVGSPRPRSASSSKLLDPQRMNYREETKKPVQDPHRMNYREEARKLIQEYTSPRMPSRLATEKMERPRSNSEVHQSSISVLQETREVQTPKPDAGTSDNVAKPNGVVSPTRPTRRSLPEIPAGGGGGGGKGRAKVDKPSTTTTTNTTTTTTPTTTNTPHSNKVKQKKLKPLLQRPRPVSADPSNAALRLARLKERNSKIVERKEKEEKQDEVDKGPVKEEEAAKTPPPPAQPPKAPSATTPSRNLESPSAWSEHSDILSQDLLVTRSDYVRGELMKLQDDLHSLEEKASNIEIDIRNVMSLGDKEQEEQLMKEWFAILNGKNDLIKKQIELNMLEKEEDLEKRQFFLNRQLRSLMQIEENQKTEEQKEMESRLLKQLLQLIDERDKLEKKKLTAENEAETERAGFEYAQSKASELVHAASDSKQEKCIIS